MFTEVIIRRSFGKASHSRKMIALNHLRRNGLWKINAILIIRGIIFRCVTFWKLLGKFSKQKIADFPEERCTETPPVIHCVVYLFRPFIINKNRFNLIK